MAGEENRYTLEYYTVNETDRRDPPFKYRTIHLSDALAAAWLNKDEGGRVVKILHETEVIFDEEELHRALERMSQLDEKLRLAPKQLAEQVMREMSKAEKKET